MVFQAKLQRILRCKNICAKFPWTYEYKGCGTRYDSTDGAENFVSFLFSGKSSFFEFLAMLLPRVSASLATVMDNRYSPQILRQNLAKSGWCLLQDPPTKSFQGKWTNFPANWVRILHLFLITALVPTWFMRGNLAVCLKYDKQSLRRSVWDNVYDRTSKTTFTINSR